MGFAMTGFAAGSLAVAAAIAATGDESEPAASVRLEPAFDVSQFREPDSPLWPGYFWLWNAPLEEDLLRAQLADMASHGARSVCMLPMPHAFRPDTTNNSMEPDYLTGAFFDRVRIAVDETVKLGMTWWLYDEGGWPSGSALGKVVEGHPELQGQRLVCEPVESAAAMVVPEHALALIVDDAQQTVLMPGQTWTPAPGANSAKLYRVVAHGAPDLMNPAAVERFIALTHAGYGRAIGERFGDRVLFAFTDEPGVPNLDPPNSVPWTPEFSARPDLLPLLPSLFTPPGPDAPAAVGPARIAFYELWTARFRDAYFAQIRDWCRRNGLASGGHLNGEDETANAVRYGYGHALRQLRAMDVPGVDVIWRQLVPGLPNQGSFPRLASSAAHQNGTRYAFTESFAVYGNGITPAQMKWLVDYQYVRGINLLVGACYPLSTRDHHMTGERPHYCPANPLWDHMPGFHAYVARLGYALSVGRPGAGVALYYPARDMWAWGLQAARAIESHDMLARELAERPCDFDFVDDDLLAAACIEEGRLVAGAMLYDTILCGEVRWMHPDSLRRLDAFAEAGGKVVCVGGAPGVDGSPGQGASLFVVAESAESAASCAVPTVDLLPRTRDVRATTRTVSDGRIVFLFNEGIDRYDGELGVTARYAYELLPMTGLMRVAARREGRLQVELDAGESLLLLLTDTERDAGPSSRETEDVIALDDAMTARPTRRYVVGDHDFEIRETGGDAVPLAQAVHWADWLGGDFSGEVEYRATFEVPDAWAGFPIRVETGPIAYAATVLLDGSEAGALLWSPWRLDLSPCTPGAHELVLRVANTLANELTSQRVTDLWAAKEGPGWPSPYHVRAIGFERESRGGGLAPSVVLRRMEPRGPDRP